jgi:hypothetical protein
VWGKIAVKAIHLVCKYDRDCTYRDGWNNLFHADGQHYDSGYWSISEDESRALMASWLYLNEAKNKLSGFGGKIPGIKVVRYEEAYHKNGAVVRNGEEVWRCLAILAALDLFVQRAPDDAGIDFLSVANLNALRNCFCGSRQSRRL